MKMNEVVGKKIFTGSSKNNANFKLTTLFSVLIFISSTFLCVALTSKQVDAKSSELYEDTYRKQVFAKSIVFDIKTPKVFYCPQERIYDDTNLIVKSRPLSKLCEYNGKGKPNNKHSDCYNDIDESELACAEKERIELKIKSTLESIKSTTTDDKSLSSSQDSILIAEQHIGGAGQSNHVRLTARPEPFRKTGKKHKKTTSNKEHQTN